MSKIYLTADNHLGMKGDNPIWLKDCFDYYNNIFIPFCKKYVQPDDILIFLGDVFDNRSSIGLETITLTIKLFEYLSDIFNDIRIIVGNHDIFKKHSNEITSLHMLKHIPHVKIYFEPIVEEISEKKCLFVPWIEEIDEQKKLLKSHNVDYVFGHLEIGGCITSSKGTTLHTNNSIQSTDFKKAHVFAGHIHIRQDYKNISYVGCPYSKDRGDINNKKGFTILDVETGRTKFVENTYSPKFIRVNGYDILDKTVGDLKKNWNNNYVDLVIKNTHVPLCRFDMLREIFTGIYKEFNLVSDNSEVIVENNAIQLSESKSMNELVDEYLVNYDLDDDVKKNIKFKIEKYNETTGCK